jgi:hypothetical protein
MAKLAHSAKAVRPCHCCRNCPDLGANRTDSNGASPWILLGGTAVPALCFLYAVLFPNPDIGDTIEKYLSGVAIAAVAATLTIWTAVFTMAIGCGIVWIMKGPAYVADRYPLIDADSPTEPTPAGRE